MYGHRRLSSALRTPTTAEILIFAVVGFMIYGVIATAQRWTGELRPTVEIDLSLNSLPVYTVYSLFRGLIAYAISLSFTFVIGYLAARNRIAERIILPLLDIGQSIPVLGFLPGLVLGLIAIFPNTNIGLELACILMIFTGQVWNLTFAFYASLKAVPTQLREMGEIVGMSRLRRVFSVDLPFASTALAWNSLISMAGGWFFLTICESFTLGDREFHLPGLGSYMAIAIEQGNRSAIISGLLAMLLVILVMDFLIWRPIIAWTGRFREERSAGDPAEIPFVSLLLKESRFVQAVASFLMENFRRFRAWRSEKKRNLTEQEEAEVQVPLSKRWARWWKRRPVLKGAVQVLLSLGLAVFAFWVVGRLYTMMAPLLWSDWALILKGTVLTFVRVFLALILATAWTLPVGIAIGLSPKLTRIFQPIIQAAASFPAPMLYPIVLTVFLWLGVGLAWSSVFLMLLGMQWYILFNVLAGAVGISAEHRQNFQLMGVSTRDKWWALYIPSVFPSLITGWVAAAGGAWNASIVAEFLHFKGESLSTLGLGSIISQATIQGNYPLLCASLLVMIVSVVGFNRLVWHRLFQLSESRYRFER